MNYIVRQIASMTMLGFVPTIILYNEYGPSQNFIFQMKSLIWNGPIGWYFAYLSVLCIIVLLFNFWFVDLKYNIIEKLAIWVKNDFIPFYVGTLQAAAGIVLSLAIIALRVEGIYAFNFFWAIFFIAIACFFLLSAEMFIRFTAIRKMKN